MMLFQNILCISGYLILIVLTCNLFVNSIEHLGKKLNLGDSATGSILAAVGTALPETILPLIAILTAGNSLKDGVEIGTGAILGSPFLLSTFALFISGICFTVFNRAKITDFLNLNAKNFRRDYKYFITAYFTAFLLSFVKVKAIKITVGILLIFYWIFYAIRTITETESANEEKINPLYLGFFKKGCESLLLITVQTGISLILLVIFSKLFIGEVQYFSVLTSVNPLIVSLLLSPVATELPEITNCIIWIKNKKDSLAISNITGAMVYQASICTAIGLIFTDWVLNINACINVFCTLIAVLSVFILTGISKKISAITLISTFIWYPLFILLDYIVSLR